MSFEGYITFSFKIKVQNIIIIENYDYETFTNKVEISYCKRTLQNSCICRAYNYHRHGMSVA